MIVTVHTMLAASPGAVWNAVQTAAAFLHVTRGLMGFSGARRFPARWRPGDFVRTRMWFFHVIPAPWRHHLRVERVAADAREIQSREHGGFIATWDHLIRVEEAADGCARYTDQITIQAGRLTPLVGLYSRVFYRYRQARWRAYARRLNPARDAAARRARVTQLN